MKQLCCLCIYTCILLAGARQRFSKYVPPATNTHGTIEKLLDALFSMRSAEFQMKVREQFLPEILVSFFLFLKIFLS
jgi:capsule polysaccharide export protein KpsC/LpsZ